MELFRHYPGHNRPGWFSCGSHPLTQLSAELLAIGARHSTMDEQLADMDDRSRAEEVGVRARTIAAVGAAIGLVAWPAAMIWVNPSAGEYWDAADSGSSTILDAMVALLWVGLLATAAHLVALLLSFQWKPTRDQYLATQTALLGLPGLMGIIMLAPQLIQPFASPLPIPVLTSVVAAVLLGLDRRRDRSQSSSNESARQESSPKASVFSPRWARLQSGIPIALVQIPVICVAVTSVFMDVIQDEGFGTDTVGIMTMVLLWALIAGTWVQFAIAVTKAVRAGDQDSAASGARAKVLGWVFIIGNAVLVLLQSGVVLLAVVLMVSASRGPELGFSAVLIASSLVMSAVLFVRAVGAVRAAAETRY